MWRRSLMVVGGGVMLWVCAAIALPAHSVTVDVFAIGQGDAALVQEGAVQAVIDGGPNGSVLAKLGEVMPFFDRTIEFLVITHPHEDHFAGAIDILERYEVQTVIIPGTRGEGHQYARLVRAWERAGADVIVVRRGDTIRMSPATYFDVVWPDEGEYDDPNDTSIVLRLSVRGTPVAYFTGDISTHIERTVHDWEHVPLLKVAHHGSRTSSSPEFLAAVRPKFATISVGRNWYGHPSQTVLSRLRRIGTRVFRTDQDGDVRFIFSGDGIEVRTK